MTTTNTVILTTTTFYFDHFFFFSLSIPEDPNLRTTTAIALDCITGARITLLRSRSSNISTINSTISSITNRNSTSITNSLPQSDILTDCRVSCSDEEKKWGWM